MSVSCSDKELRGDEVITCNQGTDFQFQQKPKCNDVGTYELDATTLSRESDGSFHHGIVLILSK